MFFGIIIHGAVMTGDSHRHIDRSNLLIAVSNDEGYFREVCVVVVELTCGEAHISLAVSIRAFHNIGTGCRSGAAESKVIVNIIQTCLGCSRVSAHTVLIAIVCSNVAGTHNGDSILNRSNLLPTVGHHKSHRIKVRVGVGELTFGKTHIGLAVNVSTFYHVSTGSSSGTSKGEVSIAFAHLIERSIGSSGKACHGMSDTVVRFRISFTYDRHGHVDWQDSLVTIGYHEGYRAEVRVRVGELVLRTSNSTLEAHEGGTSISSGSGNDIVHQGSARSRREGEVSSHVIQWSVSRSDIALHGMQITVIIYSICITNDSNDSGDGGDSKQACVNRYCVVQVGSSLSGHTDDIATHILASFTT